MRLRVTRKRMPRGISVIGLLAFVSVSSAQSKQSPPPSAMAYIIDHLKRAEGSRIAADLPEKVLDSPYLFRGVKSSGECELSFEYRGTLINAKGLVGQTFSVALKLKDAELDGEKSMPDRIVVRMGTAAKVQVELLIVLTNKSTDLETDPPPVTKSTREWFTVPLPAVDEEDALRIGRALNQQIRTCGGKTDPFAK